MRCWVVWLKNAPASRQPSEAAWARSTARTCAAPASASTVYAGVHLPAVIDAGHGFVLAHRHVSTKTNELPMYSQLLDTTDDLDGAVVTADVLHIQRPHADYLVVERGPHFLLTVKRNQPELHAQLAELPWTDDPIAHTTPGGAWSRGEAQDQDRHHHGRDHDSIRTVRPSQTVR
jgi:hypothetical protein